MPRGNRPGHPGVVQRSGTSKPARQFFLGTDVVPGKHLQASEAPEQRVLGGPATNPSQLEQLLSDRVVIFLRERLEVQPLCRDRSREIEEGTRLLAAEPNRPQVFRRHMRQVLRRRKGVHRIRRRAKWGPASCCEPIEERQPRLQGQLLAGETGHDSLEGSRKSGRLYTSKPVRQPPQARSDTGSV